MKNSQTNPHISYRRRVDGLLDSITVLPENITLEEAVRRDLLIHLELAAAAARPCLPSDKKKML